MPQEKLAEDRHGLKEQLQQGPDKWVYHAASLDHKSDVRTEVFAQPVKPMDRIQAIGRLLPVDRLDPNRTVSILSLYERRLTARAPFQESPLSYLKTWGRSWEVAPDEGANGTISWSDTGMSEAGIYDDVRRPGSIEFDFWNVTVDRPVLITIAVSTMAEAGRTGQLEVRGDPPINGLWAFPVAGGYSHHTLDLTVQLPAQPLVTVRLRIGDGVMLFHLHELTYTTL